jgi:Rrf2 family iron-sulfur cluster assembly transcriptional regulator
MLPGLLDGREAAPASWRGVRFSLQAQYAVCGVFDLAYNGQGAPVPVQVIGERQAIPARYLEQIFQRLRRARLVTGKRGPGGGYVLARPAASITIRDVVEAVEGGADRWFAPANGAGETVDYRPAFLWPRLAERFADVLGETTVEALCREAARTSVRRAAVELSYVI